jgi:hypothetical protein
MSSASSKNKGFTEINLKPFLPATMIYDHASMLFAGAKKTGKSFCARCICYYIKDRVYDATVFTGSEEEDHPWNQYVPDTFVHDDYSEDVMTAVIARQQDRKRIAKAYRTKPASHMVVFEDLEYRHHNVFYDESCKRVLLNGRHDKTYPMVLVQYIMKGLTREVRGMFDFVFLQKEPDIAVRKKLWQVFGGVCKDFEDFDTIFRMCTENYGTLVIFLRANSYEISDNFFWFKSREMGQFNIGHPDVWRFHQKNYKSNNIYEVNMQKREQQWQQQQPQAMISYSPAPSPSRSGTDIDEDVVADHVHFQQYRKRAGDVECQHYGEHSSSKRRRETRAVTSTSSDASFARLLPTVVSTGSAAPCTPDQRQLQALFEGVPQVVKKAYVPNSNTCIKFIRDE